jgi:hypothetical protein
MTIIGRFAVTTAALAFASSAYPSVRKPAESTGPGPQLRPMTAPASSIQGELMKVDTTAKTSS